jgi:hypothetical protein
MTLNFRTVPALAAVLLLALPQVASAADRKDIDAAIKRGTDWIRNLYSVAGTNPAMPPAGGHGIGPTCLSGLALLEGGVPVDDPALKRITQLVREAAYTETRTYQLSLCLMFLDRLGDPADVPLIQALAVRLLVGQTHKGGWTYSCISGVSAAELQLLKAMKPNQDGPAGKLHPDVERYAQSLVATRGQTGGIQPGDSGTDDNSNTQFAVLAIWMARKHGVPVENALKLIEQRFLATQSPRTGGWGYIISDTRAGFDDALMGSPSMHCAGLIGLATAVGRREERLAQADAKKEPPKTPPDSKKNLDDPFFNPPAKGTEPKKTPKRAPDHIDRAVQLALAGLGQHVAESARAGRGALVIANEGQHGRHDLYFLWSLERVGVIFGVEKLGGVNWYEAGAHSLVLTQARDGSWGTGPGYGPEVGTAFAVLFLCRSNLARDLSSKVQKEVSTELRAGTGPGSNDPRPNDPRPTDPFAGGSGSSDPLAGVPSLPGITNSEVGTLAGQLLRASDAEWARVLQQLRDGKGSVYTQALVTALDRLDGDRLKIAREALAERLTRMTAATLRQMAASEESELRRAAVLAMAMKDDKQHIPDLIAALQDDEDLVVRAARAALKSLTGEDFGPRANATAGDKKIAIDSWNNWLSRQKK